MQITPTIQNERLEVLDALRGFALFGILLANLYSFLGYSTLTPTQITNLPIADRTVLFGIDWFIEGKFYSIFSMLFGMGFALQFSRMQDYAKFQKYWQRRMVILLCFGLSHMLFIWHGDILTLYSILGMVLICFRNLSNAALLKIAILLLTWPIIMHGIVSATQDASFWKMSSSLINSWKQDLGLAEKSLLELRTSNSLQELFSINILKAAGRPMSYFQTGRITQVLGMFILGIFIIRAYLPAITANKLLSPKLWKIPLWIGLATSLGYAVIKGMIGSPYALDGLGMLQAILYHTGAPLLGLGIAGAFYSAWQARGKVTRFLSFFSTLGRMALSNYILQNVTAVLIFFGYGAGLMGTVPFANIPIIAASILFLQWCLCTWWLKNYSQGPLEILWKRLAYKA